MSAETFAWRSPEEKPTKSATYLVLLSVGDDTNMAYWDDKRQVWPFPVRAWMPLSALAALPVAPPPKRPIICRMCGYEHPSSYVFGNCIDFIGCLTRQLSAAAARAEKAERERDAYKKAKDENDERFMRERDEARAELKKIVEAGREWYSRCNGIAKIHVFDDALKLQDTLRPHMESQPCPKP